MKEEVLKQKVDDIIALGGDPEAAHSMEDDLHIEIIKTSFVLSGCEMRLIDYQTLASLDGVLKK